MGPKNLLLIALGGNAISRSNEEGNVEQQFANSRRTAGALADLLLSGHQLVITHGNGPQIGNFLLRNEAAADRIYPLPMEVAVAHVQGGMGYMIAQTLTNELHARGDRRLVSTIVTTVEVDPDDPAFAHPAKPIGRVLAEVEALKFASEGWTVREISPGKSRRVVPSPIPRHVMEIELIRRSVNQGDVLVVCGGGGIPVVRDKKTGAFRGTAAVIDKDLASAVVAVELDVDGLLILTDVERVCINFGKPDARPLERMTVDEAEGHLRLGQFPPGSMGPKVQGAINFLRGSKKPHSFAVIGPLDRAADAVAGRIGTRITKR